MSPPTAPYPQTLRGFSHGVARPPADPVGGFWLSEEPIALRDACVTIRAVEATYGAACVEVVMWATRSITNAPKY